MLLSLTGCLKVLSWEQRAVVNSYQSLQSTIACGAAICNRVEAVLQDAADRGCDVRLLVWDDRTSTNLFGGYLSAGVMNTFDEAVRKYFKDSANIHCRLVGRSGGAGNSVLEGQTAASCFSHHQVLRHDVELENMACCVPRCVGGCLWMHVRGLGASHP